MYYNSNVTYSIYFLIHCRDDESGVMEIYKSMNFYEKKIKNMKNTSNSIQIQNYALHLPVFIKESKLDLFDEVTS